MRNYIKNAHFPDNMMMYHNLSEEVAELKLRQLINDIFIDLFENFHLVEVEKHNAHVKSYSHKIKFDIPYLKDMDLKDIKNIEVIFYIDDRLDTFSNIDKAVIIITNNENYGLLYCSFYQIDRLFIELIDEEFDPTEIPHMVSANDEICLNALKISKIILAMKIVSINLKLDIVDMYSNSEFNILDSLVKNIKIFRRNGFSVNDSISLVCNIAEARGDYEKYYHRVASILELNSIDEDDYDEDSLETALNTNYRESQIENKKGFRSFIRRIFNR